MHVRLAIGIAIALAATALASMRAARADHTASERITDETPHALRPGEWRLGLWKIERGLSGPGPLDRVQVGSYTVFWAPWALGAPSANAQAKWEIARRDPLSVGVGVGVFYLDLRNLDAPVTMAIVPVDLYAAYRIRDRWTVSLRATLTSTSIEGRYDEDEVEILRAPWRRATRRRCCR